ncbi:hypothetical protein GDO81_002102 [Engystomops pustulosus]|nr:hypothetical protein GDO81_002102 [Engystomops pustulosus]
MKEDFFIKIETWHKPDMGTQENVHCLDPNVWKTVEVVHIDIADRSQVEPSDYKADEDPAIFQSFRTKRGPLGPNWKKELANSENCPRMCAYKLVTIKFRWWGLQNKVESFIQKQEKRIFTNFHRQLFCWIDKWIDLTMEDIRRMEDETQKELEAVRVLILFLYCVFHGRFGGEFSAHFVVLEKRTFSVYRHLLRQPPHPFFHLPGVYRALNSYL